MQYPPESIDDCLRRHPQSCATIFAYSLGCTTGVFGFGRPPAFHVSERIVPADFFPSISGGSHPPSTARCDVQHLLDEPNSDFGAVVYRLPKAAHHGRIHNRCCGSSPVMARLAVLALLGALSAHPSRACDLPGLERTVSSYPSGQPLTPLRCFRDVPGAISFLAGVLADRRRAQTWPMTVAVLGAIGDNSAYDILVAFLSQQQRTVDAWGRMTELEFSSKVDAILMIDYLRRCSPDVHVQERASALLHSLTAPGAWRRYAWMSPEHATRQQSDSYLTSKVRFALQREPTITGAR